MTGPDEAEADYLTRIAAPPDDVDYDKVPEAVPEWERVHGRPDVPWPGWNSGTCSSE
jgi:hypothetical protein